MNNPASRLAKHIRAVAEFDKTKSMLDNFRVYFAKDDVMLVVQCLYFINKEIDQIEKMLQEKKISTDALKSVRSLFQFTCLNTTYSSLASHSTEQLPMIIDGYSLAMKDEDIETELQDIQAELSNIIDSITDENILSIVQQTIKALEMYPCAGFVALNSSLLTSLGRFGLYIHKSGTNSSTKKLSEVFEKILNLVEKTKRYERAETYIEDTLRQLFNGFS